MRPMIMPDGTEALVEDVDFEVEGKDPELIMKLSDGTIMKAKLVPTQVLRLDRYNPDGTPQYIMQSQTIIRVKVPSELMGKDPQKIGKGKSPQGHVTGNYIG